jgi:rhamnosyltransferase
VNIYTITDRHYGSGPSDIEVMEAKRISHEDNHRSLIGAVVILFDPPCSIAEHINALSRQFPALVVVVNEATQTVINEIKMILGVCLIENHRNLGIATALNQGLRRQFEDRSIGFVLLLDQDSRPSPDLGGQLRRAFVEAQARGLRPACVGPRLVDMKSIGIYKYPDASDELLVSRSIATSGCLISRDVFDAVGGMMECLFIDQVDHEWCFRARSTGLNIIVSAKATMAHNLGVQTVRFLGTNKAVHKSPVRHYFIIRNTLVLMSLNYIPMAWKVSEFFKTIRRIAAYIVFSSDRRMTIKAIGLAISDALSGNVRGAIPGEIAAQSNRSRYAPDFVDQYPPHNSKQK